MKASNKKVNLGGRNMLQKRRKERGDFVVSMIVGLILSALVAGAAYVTLRDSSRDTDVTTSIKTINATAGNFRTNFGVDNRFSDVTTAVAVQTRTIPEGERIAGTTTAQNAFGGSITAAPATLTNTNDAVAYSWANVPAWACSRIVAGTQAQARLITVGGQAVKPLDGQLNTATLSTQCDGAGPFTIVWSIGRTAA